MNEAALAIESLAAAAAAQQAAQTPAPTGSGPMFDLLKGNATVALSNATAVAGMFVS